MQVIRESTIRHASAQAFNLKQGDLLRVETPKGGQVSNLSFEYFNQGLTRDNDRIRRNLKKTDFRAVEGTILYDNDNVPVMELIENHSSASHDLHFVGCRREVLRSGGMGCLDLIADALHLPRLRIPPTISLFLDVEDFQIVATRAKPGDYVVFRVLRGVDVGVTSCPAPFHPNPSEIRVAIDKVP
jgi:uncharacterized protein YcgI (DUF1989 family)